jgi:photosystem II stability/assembly factor-like uncharacterized protein
MSGRVGRAVQRIALAATLIVTMLAQTVPAEAFPFSMAIHVAEPCGVAGQQATGSMVIDYADGFKSSSPSRLRKAGVGIVIRYVAASKWKCMTRSEATALRKGDIDIAVVYETDAKWMLKGRAAGVVAAKKARAAVKACGGPSHPFVYFACDTATSKYGTVNSCLAGAASVLGKDHVGIYGSYYVCAHALQSGYATKAWQTEAWSNGHVLPQAVLYQTAHRFNGSLGVGYDSNHMRAEDIGQWGYVAGGNPVWAVQSMVTTATFNAVDFTDGNSGWAVGADGTVVHTANGGLLWTSQSSATTATLGAVDFADTKNGWAVGEGGAVVHTSNGGSTWATQTVPATATLNAVHFANSTTGWAAGADGTILRTADGGSTWTAQSTPTSATLTGIDFGASNTTYGCAVGAGGTTLRTTNGGTSWTIQPSATTKKLNGVMFADTLTGWAVGEDGTMLRTKNGGYNWSPHPSGTTATLDAVTFADTRYGWAVGEDGTILRSTDGGSSWTAQASSTTSDLHGIDCVDSNTSWAVGDGGIALHITNGRASVFGMVAGVVRDAKTGAALPGVSVKIGSRPAMMTATDGSFIAARVAPGTYTVTVSGSRYITTSATGVVVTAGVRSTVDLRPTPKTRTHASVPVASPRAPRRGQVVRFTTTLSPSAAAGSNSLKAYFFHREKKMIRKRVRGRIRHVKVWYWRYRSYQKMASGGSGSFFTRRTLSSGKWHVYVKCSGSSRYLPSSSGIRSVYVK